MRVAGPIVVRDAGKDVLLRHWCLPKLQALAVVFCPARLGDLGLIKDGIQWPCEKHVCVHVEDAIVLGEFEEAKFCELVDPAREAGLCGPVCGIEERYWDYGCTFFGEDLLFPFGDVGRDDDEEREAELCAG